VELVFRRAKSRAVPGVADEAAELDGLPDLSWSLGYLPFPSQRSAFRHALDKTSSDTYRKVPPSSRHLGYWMRKSSLLLERGAGEAIPANRSWGRCSSAAGRLRSPSLASCTSVFRHASRWAPVLFLHTFSYPLFASFL